MSMFTQGDDFYDMGYAKGFAAGQADANDRLTIAHMDGYAKGREAMRAELAKPAAGPEGWVMVPKEPTPEMCAVFPAYDGSTYSNGFDSQDFADNYRAMLAAAPQPPALAVDVEASA